MLWYPAVAITAFTVRGAAAVNITIIYIIVGAFAVGILLIFAAIPRTMLSRTRARRRIRRRRGPVRASLFRLVKENVAGF